MLYIGANMGCLKEAEKYLEKILHYTCTVHLDMGGNHRYSLTPKAWPVITEAKAWLADREKEKGTKS